MLYDERWGTKETKTRINPWQVILILAADKLETDGWIQGAFLETANNKITGRCALGAIRAVGNGNVYQYQAEATLEHALGFPIVSWNDHPSRTKEEVVAKLREVAMAKLKTSG